MVDWVPIQHQLDILRMDVQYVLRQVIIKTDNKKVYRSAKGDYLPFILEQHGLLIQIDEGFSADRPALFEVTRFGRMVAENDHALREIAMEYMNWLDGDTLDILQNSIYDWYFRDPAVLKFMQEVKGAAGGPSHADFFPQAPWYYHTTGTKNVPKRIRDLSGESDYTQGGYTGVESSAWDIAHSEQESKVS